MHWRKLLTNTRHGVFRYHVGRSHVVMQMTEPYSQRKHYVSFVELLRVQLCFANITWQDIESYDGHFSISPHDIGAYVDASPLEAFKQTKQKKRK